MMTSKNTTLDALCAAALSHGSLRPAGYEDEKATWIVAPCGAHRDSDLVDESNHAVALDRYMEIDPAGDDWCTVRFGHFAVGWIDEIIVRPGSACAAAAEQMRVKLADYPILDDDHHSELECEYESENWASIMSDLRDAVVREIDARHARGDYADDATHELARDHADDMSDDGLTTFAHDRGETDEGWRRYSSRDVREITDLVEADAGIKAQESADDNAE